MEKYPDIMEKSYNFVFSFEWEACYYNILVSLASSRSFVVFRHQVSLSYFTDLDLLVSLPMFMFLGMQFCLFYSINFIVSLVSIKLVFIKDIRTLC